MVSVIIKAVYGLLILPMMITMSAYIGKRENVKTERTISRAYKIVGILLLAVAVSIGTVGCTKEAKGEEKIHDAKSYNELRNSFNTFVIKTYTPRNQSEMVEGLNSIKQYVTAELFERLSNDIGEYKENIDSYITDLDVSYIKKENSTNNLFNKLNVSFRVINGDRSQVYAIEFIENSQQIYDDYNIFKGIVETRD